LEKKLVFISNVSFQYTDFENYYQVKLNGIDANGDIISEELDLAYVYVEVNGKAKCLGLHLGLECDPCSLPFTYPKVSFQYDNNQFTSSQESEQDVNLNCFPVEYDPIILSGPDINQLHPDWVDSEVGEAWTFLAYKSIVKNNTEYFRGDLLSPRGGYMENGPFYVLSSEWECSNNYYSTDSTAEVTDYSYYNDYVAVEPAPADIASIEYFYRAEEPENYFTIFLNKTGNDLAEVLIQHQPTLNDCRVVFKSDFYLEAFKSYNEIFGLIGDETVTRSSRFENKSTCRAVEFNTNEVISQTCNSCPGRFDLYADKLNPDITGFHIKFLENEFSEAGSSFSFFTYINNRWVYFPVN
jgi:hypothetical protein